MSESDKDSDYDKERDALVEKSYQEACQKSNFYPDDYRGYIANPIVQRCRELMQKGFYDKVVDDEEIQKEFACFDDYIKACVKASRPWAGESAVVDAADNGLISPSYALSLNEVFWARIDQFHRTGK
jgi:stalled ribosome rescue protein Dom34